MAVQKKPDGYHTVTPYIIVNGAAAALEFYTKAFNATELFRMEGPGGSIMHAEFKIGDSPIMIADEHPEMGAVGPKTVGGTPVSIMLYVDDVDAIYKQSLAAGAKTVRDIANQFYGDRSACIEDPFGHKWTVSTHVEDVTPEEINRRFEEMMKAK